MAPTRGGVDAERSRLRDVPGVVIDAEGKPLGGVEEMGLGGEVRPGRTAKRRSGRLARGLRGIGNRLLGNNG